MDLQAEKQLIGLVSKRLQWILLLMMFIAFMDRTNISFVASFMNKDIGLSARQFGWGASLFFVGYLLFEIPSNLIMARVGARLWLARIMISWGIVSCASAFIVGPNSFYLARFLLGVAEAGFIPGVVLYLSYWVPHRYLGKFTGWFLMIVPISASLTAMLTAVLLGLDEVLGVTGWRWVFFTEGLPAIVVGFFLLRYLADKPASATWLSTDQRTQLQAMVNADQVGKMTETPKLKPALTSPSVWCLGGAYFFMNVALGAQTWYPLSIHLFKLSRPWETASIAIPSAIASLSMLLWAKR